MFSKPLNDFKYKTFSSYEELQRNLKNGDLVALTQNDVLFSLEIFLGFNASKKSLILFTVRYYDESFSKDFQNKIWKSNSTIFDYKDFVKILK